MDAIQLFRGSTPLWGSTVVVVVDMVLRLIALGVIPHNRRPSAAWGWLLAVFFIPVVGVLLYLVVGRSSLPAERQRKQRAIGGLATGNAGEGCSEGDTSGVPEWAKAVARLNYDSRGLPLLAGNTLDILDDYDSSIDRIAQAVRSSRRSVHFEFYIFAADGTTEPLIRALVDAHERGVDVRVLIDYLRSRGFPGHKRAVQRLEGSGVRLRRSLPVRPWRLQYQRPDLRNHRKIVVVDGEVAFTGSQNMIDASYNKKKNLREHLQWRDLML